jgi:hypothetical protein
MHRGVISSSLILVLASITACTGAVSEGDDAPLNPRYPDVGSNSPEDPNDPNNPSVPNDPNNPSVPSDPNNPSVPSDPNNPGSGTGGGPADPTAPNNPNNPAVPLTPPKTREEACATRTVPEQPLRRLSASEYKSTIRDLFGSELAPTLLSGSLFPPTQISSGFEADAEANVVNTAESNAIEDNAEHIASTILAKPDAYLRKLLPCDLPTTIGDSDIDGCVADFITEFGLRAYRRPLTAKEKEIAQGVYELIRAEQSGAEAFSALVQYFVQSPALLYRVERGTQQIVPGIKQLSGYERAARLSYLFAGSTPDAALLDAAAKGELDSPAQVRAQAERLMGEPGFNSVLTGFHRDWLRLYELETAAKDVTLFPEMTTEVRKSMLEESGEFVRHVFATGDGSISSLFSTTALPVNGALAGIYGVDRGGAAANEWVAVQMSGRKGILSLASIMATLAKPDRTNPIHRGAFVKREILCQFIPALPGTVDIQGPLKDASVLPTARERLQPLTDNAQCTGCHTLFNPIGLAFETFDALGRLRTEENGAPIDTSGQIDLGAGVVAFQNTSELLDGIANSSLVRDCYALQWYRAAMGRLEFAQDSCGIYDVRAAAETTGSVREMLLALTQTDAFLNRNEVTQ